jgi:putative two-component system response regulator
MRVDMSETVLFVDDEEYVLNSIMRTFVDSDLRILTASSADKAMEIVNKESVAVIVSDNMMPGMKGLELLNHVKKISSDTVKILMTAYADLPTAIEAINTGGVFRFIVKPWDNQILLDSVRDGIDQYRLLQALRRGDDEAMLNSLAQTIELKDPYTRGHCNRVALYALMIADMMKLPEKLQNDIKHGSWLHDCGKIGVPEKVLNYPGKLTKDDFLTIKKHPDWGAEVARLAKLSTPVVNIIHFHHERWDGRGYPSGISGINIPLEARIVTVADVYDALTTDRPYRCAFTIEKSRSILASLKGRSLEPRIVDMFLSLVH